MGYFRIKLFEVLLLVLLIICGGKQNSKLDQALFDPGENKRQFEIVLHHYSSPENSLKHKAAVVYLIENMVAHGSLKN